jgi:hypothetical protein
VVGEELQGVPMRRFVIESRDLISAITRPYSITIAWPFIISNMANDGVLSVTDFSNDSHIHRYFPVYKDVEEFRKGLEIGFKCTIMLIGSNEINIGKLEKVVDKF